MTTRPNILFILCDQLRATSLPRYGETQIETPNLDRLADKGVTLDNMIAGCPVCTPSRAMLVTGRHPQTTGHLMNSVRTRHCEISVADTFAHAGYRTGWIGKWHLHTGHWPALDLQPMQPDWVPKGRDRLGFEFWRGYNQHMVFFDGFVQKGDWEVTRWDGYETDGLFAFTREFIETRDDRPFCLFVSPHQPHYTPGEFVPEAYYDRLPENLTLPPNVPDGMMAESLEMYRHYLAMTLALDDMVGETMAFLEAEGLADDTILIFTSDHGTSAGSHGIDPWQKKMPYETSIRIPFFVRWPGHLPAGARSDALTAMVDLFPSLATMAGLPIPRTVEGMDRSGAWAGDGGAEDRDCVFLMNFSAKFDWLETGLEWRGVRTAGETYVRRLDGRTEMYDNRADPHQMTDLSGRPEEAEREARLSALLNREMERRGDTLCPITDMNVWFDEQRRIVRNGYGLLGNPENLPDWSLLRPADRTAQTSPK